MNLAVKMNNFFNKNVCFPECYSYQSDGCNINLWLNTASNDWLIEVKITIIHCIYINRREVNILSTKKKLITVVLEVRENLWTLALFLIIIFSGIKCSVYCVQFRFEFILVHYSAVVDYALAPGIFDNTFEISTPVSALMAGGNWPTNRVTSPVQWSLPPISTISSVLANGAAISAAIYTK